MRNDWVVGGSGPAAYTLALTRITAPHLGVTAMRFITCGLLLACSIGAAAAAQTPPPKFDRDALGAATAAKPSQAKGMVTKHSLALAACRSAAARYGKFVGNDLRLLDRRTFLISGVITPTTGGAAREVPDRAHKQQRFNCTVTDSGQVLEHSFGDLPPRSLAPRLRPDSL